MDNYPVIQIPTSRFRRQKDLEGAVPKGWINDPSLGEILFKEATVDQEDFSDYRSDWSEKVVSELNQLLLLPAARYELASIVGEKQENPGTVSLNLAQPKDEERIPLENFLETSLSQYRFPSDYTAKTVIDALENNNVRLPSNYQVPDGIKDGADMFVGMLLLDAAVGNDDRHDNNIDIVLQTSGEFYLSPVFDHGFSLGAVAKQELKEWISIEQYTKYHNYSVFEDNGRDLTGFEVFQQAAELRPEAAKIWLDQLSRVNTQQIEEIFDRIPSDRITPDDSRFAQELIKYNQVQLLGLQKELTQKIDLKLDAGKLQPKAEQIIDNKSFEIPRSEEFKLVVASKYLADQLGTVNPQNSKEKIYQAPDGTKIKRNPEGLSLTRQGKELKFNSKNTRVKNTFSPSQIKQQIKARTSEMQKQQKSQSLSKSKSNSKNRSISR